MRKEMMNYCAKQAGMEYFSFGSEPICTVFHVLQNCDVKLNPKGPTKFIVLDCGGGTVDSRLPFQYRKWRNIENDETWSTENVHV